MGELRVLPLEINSNNIKTYFQIYIPGSYILIGGKHEPCYFLPAYGTRYRFEILRSTGLYLYHCQYVAFPRNDVYLGLQVSIIPMEHLISMPFQIRSREALTYSTQVVVSGHLSSIS